MDILPEIDWTRPDMPFWYKGMVLLYAPEAWYEGGPPYWWRLLRDGQPSDHVIAFEGIGFAMRMFPCKTKEQGG